MKQAGGDKDMGKDMGKDKGDKKGDGKPKVLKLCDVTDLCGFCSAGSCKFKCAKCYLLLCCDRKGCSVTGLDSCKHSMSQPHTYCSSQLRANYFITFARDCLLSHLRANPG